ncbi:MAG: MBL fold metallo-hydrolase [Phycisphaerales bacterium]|nr:MBL fold metallo-hydrolase [Phycisphaerales bacterium]
MNLNRRSFIAASTLAAAGIALPARSSLARLLPSLTLADTYFEWKSVADGCHIAIGEGGNALAVLSGNETVVIDSKNGGFGEALRREAAALGSPVKTLINTHHHGDHVGGNPAFTKDLRVIAHANAIARIPSQVERSNKSAQGAIAKLKQSPKATATQVIADIEALLQSSPTDKNFLPTESIPSSGNITVGNLSIELYHVGAGHTDNDLIVYIPDRNILHGGDLLFNNMYPYHDPANSGADSAGWIRSCQKIIDLCDNKTVVIPGHGDVGDLTIAKRQIEFFTALREQAAKAFAAGATREDFIKTEPEQFKSYSSNMRPITLGGLYDEAKKEAGK